MNPFRICALALATVAASACGNTAINVSGRSLEPLSADLIQIGTTTVVRISDVSDYCTRLRSAIAANPCGGSGYTALSTIGGTYFDLITNGAYTNAQLQVYPQSTSSWNSNPAQAQVQFSSVGAPTTSMTVAGSTGTVNIENFLSGNRISGRYDITFVTGEREQGHFEARHCNALDYLPSTASCQRSECAEYIVCANAMSAGSGDALNASYGPNGTCWSNGSATADSCRQACISALASARSGSSAPSACW